MPKYPSRITVVRYVRTTALHICWTQNMNKAAEPSAGLFSGIAAKNCAGALTLNPCRLDGWTDRSTLCLLRGTPGNEKTSGLSRIRAANLQHDRAPLLCAIAETSVQLASRSARLRPNKPAPGGSVEEAGSPNREGREKKHDSFGGLIDTALRMTHVKNTKLRGA